MKFSEITKAQWDELAPFMDTCLLPVTGLTGEEAPWKTTEALELLRDTMEDLEKRYVGRLVTYPAYHYPEGDSASNALAKVCRRLKESAGFTFVVLITADPRAATLPKPDAADLFLNTMHVQSGQAISLIGGLWMEGTANDTYDS